MRGGEITTQVWPQVWRRTGRTLGEVIVGEVIRRARARINGARAWAACLFR